MRPSVVAGLVAAGWLAVPAAGQGRAVVVAPVGLAEAVADRPWGTALYREFRPPESKLVSLTLVPYYAWANRGKSEMTVWLPLKR